MRGEILLNHALNGSINQRIFLEKIGFYGALSQALTRKSTPCQLQKRNASTAEHDVFWPSAIVPYEIDLGFIEKALAHIGQAINEWNTKTPITLVKRTIESDFVRFRPKGGGCRTAVGRIGGEQSIWLYGLDGCGIGTAIHEIGHTVGLWHEHQRLDRDDYVMIPEAMLLGPRAWWQRATAPPDGEYDYASVMHYRSIETIPPGMHVGSEYLSFGDIAAVSRLYGRLPPTTTISTNPPRLEIEVDNKRVTTPATFNWIPGSKHVVEALSPQIIAGIRFLFARWTDRSPERHTISATSENPWVEASYIEQRALLGCAVPPESGKVSILPDSPDGYYTVRSPIEIQASNTFGSLHEFRQWDHETGYGPHLKDDEERPHRVSHPIRLAA